MKLKIARGATKSWTFEVRDQDGLIDLNGAKIYFAAKLGLVTISKANTGAGGSDAQIEVLSLGRYRVKMVQADTEAVVSVAGRCDSWVLTADEQRLQVLEVVTFVIGPRIATPP